MSENSHQLRTIREEFNEYLLDNGDTLRIKQVLVTFSTSQVKSDKPGKIAVKVGMSFYPVGGTIPTGNVDVTNFRVVEAHQVTEADKISKIGFKPKKLVINIYETEELLIFVRTELNEVMTTNCKDKTDIPFYRFYSGAALDAIPKQDIAPHKKEENKPSSM